MKYRKISPCIWNDAKVRELSDKGKLALLFLLTHPHMTPLGAIRANAPGLACELGWSEKVFRYMLGKSSRSASPRRTPRPRSYGSRTSSATTCRNRPMLCARGWGPSGTCRNPR
ncbi:MAG: hypothetical protein ACLSTO_01075 [Bilophila wadsworthia]